VNMETINKRCLLPSKLEFSKNILFSKLATLEALPSSKTILLHSMELVTDPHPYIEDALRNSQVSMAAGKDARLGLEK
jgi:hypothetical protein